MQNGIVKNSLSTATKARFVRFYPVTYHGLVWEWRYIGKNETFCYACNEIARLVTQLEKLRRKQNTILCQVIVREEPAELRSVYKFCFLG